MELKAQHLDIGFGKAKVIFRDINFSASEGNMIALLGVNGIGKSTLLRTMSGLQSKVGGGLTINNEDIAGLNAEERARFISIVLTERIFIDNITVRDFIALGRAPYTTWLGKLSQLDVEVIDQVIAMMHIEKLQGKLFNHTSDGEKQKALIARALCQQTPVIILDEPTAFLDFRNKREIMQLLSDITIKLKKIVIFSTHDIETCLEYCSHCWIMDEQQGFHQIARSDNFETQVKAKLMISIT